MAVFDRRQLFFIIQKQVIIQVGAGRDMSLLDFFIISVRLLIAIEVSGRYKEQGE